MKRLARGDKRILFTGFVFGRDYRTLQQNAYCYVHATEVGGTHPALLEAMGFGNCVLTLAAPENVEAIGDAGIPYTDETDLAEKLQRVLRDGSLVHAYRNRAQARVQQKYDWEYVVDRYEELFARMCWTGTTGTTIVPNPLRAAHGTACLKSIGFSLKHSVARQKPAFRPASETLRRKLRRRVIHYRPVTWLKFSCYSVALT